jgi:hypothetical protein
MAAVKDASVARPKRRAAQLNRGGFRRPAEKARPMSLRKLCVAVRALKQIVPSSNKSVSSQLSYAVQLQITAKIICQSRLRLSAIGVAAAFEAGDRRV